MIKIRGQTRHKQHVESCDKHYCHVCNKRFYSNQTCQKPHEKFSSDLLVRIVQRHIQEKLTETLITENV